MMQFCNQTTASIFIAFMWPHQDCMEGSHWEYAGWWRVDPGRCAVVFEDDLSDHGQFWYFHARNYAGPFTMSCPNVPFWRCEGETVGPTEPLRGFRELFTGDFDIATVNLLP